MDSNHHREALQASALHWSYKGKGVCPRRGLELHGGIEPPLAAYEAAWTPCLCAAEKKIGGRHPGPGPRFQPQGALRAPCGYFIRASAPILQLKW